MLSPPSSSSTAPSSSSEGSARSAPISGPYKPIPDGGSPATCTAPSLGPSRPQMHTSIAAPAVHAYPYFVPCIVNPAPFMISQSPYTMSPNMSTYYGLPPKGDAGMPIPTAQFYHPNSYRWEYGGHCEQPMQGCGSMYHVHDDNVIPFRLHNHTNAQSQCEMNQYTTPMLNVASLDATAMAKNGEEQLEQAPLPGQYQYAYEYEYEYRYNMSIGMPSASVGPEPDSKSHRAESGYSVLQEHNSTTTPGEEGRFQERYAPTLSRTRSKAAQEKEIRPSYLGKDRDAYAHMHAGANTSSNHSRDSNSSHRNHSNEGTFSKPSTSRSNSKGRPPYQYPLVVNGSGFDADRSMS